MRLKWWPFVVVGVVLLAVDVTLWVLAGKTKGDVQTAWITSGATFAVAVVAVAGTGLGAYLTAAFAFGSVRQTEQRATYATLMGAVAAYQVGKGQHLRLQTSATEVRERFAALSTSEPGYAAAKEEVIAVEGEATRATSEIPGLALGVRVATSAVRLLGPDTAAIAAENLQRTVFTDPWNDEAVSGQVAHTYEVLSRCAS
jgi:hypothetical protein